MSVLQRCGGVKKELDARGFRRIGLYSASIHRAAFHVSAHPGHDPWRKKKSNEPLIAPAPSAHPSRQPFGRKSRDRDSPQKARLRPHHSLCDFRPVTDFPRLFVRTHRGACAPRFLIA